MPPNISPSTAAMKAIAVALVFAIAATLFLILQLPEFHFLSTREGQLVLVGTIIMGVLCFWVVAQSKHESPTQL